MLDLGALLQFCRLKAGMSQGDAAREAQVTREHISMLERNKSRPSTATLQRVCDAYAMDDATRLLALAFCDTRSTPLPRKRRRPATRSAPQT